jgi:circadian clock protein KaiB
MPKQKVRDSTEAFERTLVSPKTSIHILRLYVTGMTPKSVRAIANVRTICEDHLKGRYELEVIDLYQRPQLAQGEQINAAPTLIKKLPLPLRRIIGDMSKSERVLVGLDLQKKS